MAKSEEKQRDKALELAVAQIEKAHGKGAIMKLGDQRAAVDVPVIPSGSISLDIALGIGGYPRGRIIEIYGPEASGKTTLTLHAIAESQKQGGVAAFIDAEHALDPSYARRLGVNVEELLVSQPDHGEQALEIADTLVRSGAVDIIVIDSVAALVPRAEIEGEMGDVQPGLQARLMSQALRKLTATVHKSRTSLFFINQLRHKIGVMFGSPETTTGGQALKFYASQRLDIRRVGTLKSGDQPVGSRVRVKVVKNKLAPPFQKCEFDILFGKGINRPAEVLDMAVEARLVDKLGSWYSAEGERIGQGRDNARRYLEERPELLARLERRILEAHGLLEPDASDVPANGSSKAEAPASKSARSKGGRRGAR